MNLPTDPARRSLAPLARIAMAAAIASLFAVGAAQAQRSFDPANAASVWTTDFSKHSVDYSEIFSGGVPRDGIPPIDDPIEMTIAEADELLNDTAPVISVNMNGEARAYPLGVLMRHEIVNDELGGIPISVTFCPLCNSAVVFDRRVGDQVLDFGVSGNLRHSDLIMWDRQTQSWWQQFLGEAIVGEMTGTLLDIIPVRVEGFAVFKERFPDGDVNAGSESFGGFSQGYLYNPYANYDQSAQPFLFFGDLPQEIPPLAYVVAVEDQAWSIDLLRREGRIEADDLVITWEPGQNTAMGSAEIAQGQDIGNVIVQRRVDGELVDAVHDVTFAFSFNAFRPEGTLHQ